ncbi:DUF2273 domain-containing protein [Weissella halotolerans]|uniref:Small integral membrane protein n=1 Tax=Weissella halotolerans DSM 20190 TaxID=1123500 RepID=A0A0R2FYJ4_9LACO|nr:DUF2273 domain-containing protein [Weissella halotolerans]KRN33551.1 hypothetical protein IV68_GL000357 [Weissella halotolerans DSM 20190]
MKSFVQAYRLPLIGFGLGVVLAILFLVFGFWRTLLVILLALAGAGLGFYIQQHHLLDRFMH